METREFFIAGFKHTQGPAIIDELEVNEVLEVIPEPDNTFDSNAMRLETSDGVKLGYIPRGIAEKMNDPDDPLSNFKEARIAFVDPSAKPWMAVKVELVY